MIVIDEAHNIDKYCEEEESIEINEQELINMKKELKKFMDDIQSGTPLNETYSNLKDTYSSLGPEEFSLKVMESFKLSKCYLMVSRLIDYFSTNKMNVNHWPLFTNEKYYFKSDAKNIFDILKEATKDILQDVKTFVGDLDKDVKNEVKIINRL